MLDYIARRTVTQWLIIELGISSTKKLILTRKDWHKIAKIVINIFFLQFFTRIHVEIHSDAALIY